MSEGRARRGGSRSRSWRRLAAVVARARRADRRRRAAGSAPFAPALASPPLAGPSRSLEDSASTVQGHFHAGFDLGTGRRVGRPCSPAPGLGRARARLGRGLRPIRLPAADDGRCSCSALGRLRRSRSRRTCARPRTRRLSTSRTSGPRPGDSASRGRNLAWSGESGAGGPHLHFEIRRADMAYHPQRAGLAVRDTAPPCSRKLTLEPLDSDSWVTGSAGPRTFRLDRPKRST
jgi:hypothetical protein